MVEISINEQAIGSFKIDGVELNKYITEFFIRANAMNNSVVLDVTLSVQGEEFKLKSLPAEIEARLSEYDRGLLSKLKESTNA